MADEGSGATITLGTTGAIFAAENIQGQGISWSSLGTTHLGTTGGKTFIRGDTYDPGTITVTGQWDPDLGDALIGSSAAETITITYPSALSNGATEVSSGFITNIDSGGAEVDSIMSGSITIKRTGSIVFTDASA